MKSILLIIFILYQTKLQSQVNTEQFRSSVDSNLFSNEIGINFNYSNGNSEISQLGLNGRTNYKHDSYRLFLIGFYKRGSENSRISISKGFLHLRGIYFSGKRISTELFVQKEFNKFIKLDDRNVIGSGIRIKWIKSSNTHFFSGLGVMSEHEKISEESNVHSFRNGV